VWAAGITYGQFEMHVDARISPSVLCTCSHLEHPVCLDDDER
jgi:hypothetical protein